MQLARTYADALFVARPGTNRLSRDALLVVGASLLMALSAQIAVPLAPVPMTLQTLAVPLIAAALGARRGAFAVVLYLMEGAAGLPVFAHATGGALRLVGPTAGYLWSFPIAAFVIGALVQRGWDRRPLTTLAAVLLGDAIMLGSGTAWLATSFGLNQAIALGLLPFVAFNAIKALLAAAMLPAGRRWLDRAS